MPPTLAMLVPGVLLVLLTLQLLALQVSIVLVALPTNRLMKRNIPALLVPLLLVVLALKVAAHLVHVVKVLYVVREQVLSVPMTQPVLLLVTSAKPVLPLESNAVEARS